MKRNKRQLKLVEIINNHDVETQGELIELLQAAGFSVTQATISRDINDLGITKVIAPNRRYKYICPLEEKEDLTNKYNSLFKQAVVSIKSAQNIIVIKTIIGIAAFDDTIFLALENEHQADMVKRKLNSYLQ